MGSLTSYNPIGLQGLLRDSFTFLTLKPLPTNFNNIILSDMQVDLLNIVRATLETSLCFVGSPEYIKNNLPSLVFIFFSDNIAVIYLFLNFYLWLLNQTSYTELQVKDSEFLN
jgi:hypothetical protein